MLNGEHHQIISNKMKMQQKVLKDLSKDYLVFICKEELYPLNIISCYRFKKMFTITINRYIVAIWLAPIRFIKSM